MKISKSVIAACLSLLLSVSMLSGCSSGGQPKSPPSPLTNDSTKSAAVTPSIASSIVIPSPAGWTKVDSSSVEAYAKGTASFAVKRETFKSATLDDIAKEDAGYLAKAFDKAKFIEPKKMKVGGKDAIKVSFTNGQGATSMKFETILIMSGVSTYAITCADLESSFDAAGFDKILASIEFK